MACRRLALAALLALGTYPAQAWTARANGLPKPKVIDFSSLKVVKAPTLAERHILLDGLSELPAQGAKVVLTCSVLRAKDVGRLRCDPKHPGRHPEPVAKAAEQLATAYHFDLGDHAPSREAPLKTTMTLEMQAPRIVLDATGAQPTDSALFTVARNITAFDASRNYPERAQRMEVSARTRALCQVLPDLSLGCVSATEDPAGYGFAPVAMRLGAMMTVEPVLKNGEPSQGKWVSYPFLFRAPR